MQLVFSDEFEEPGQSFAVTAGNPRWTAERLYYASTDDWEVYLPEQVGRWVRLHELLDIWSVWYRALPSLPYKQILLCLNRSPPLVALR